MSAESQNLMTGGRLVELVLAVVVSGLISGGMTGYITMRVIENDLQHLRSSHEELKQEFWELRREFYSPAWHREQSMEQLDLPDLIEELRATLHGAAKYFTGTEDDADYDLRRLLTVAAADLATRRGRTLIGEVQLEAGRFRYEDLPADLIYIKTPIWGHDKSIEPWADNYPGPLPRARVLHENGQPVLILSPSPSQQQIHALGGTYRFYYAASYWSGQASDPVQFEQENDRNLLLLRAQAEAMRELAMQNITRPVETRTNIAMPANATAGAIWERLMAEYRRHFSGVEA